LIRPLFIIWNRLKPFEQFALKLPFADWPTKWRYTWTTLF